MKTWNRKYFKDNNVLIDDMFSAFDEIDKEEGDFNIIGRVTQAVHRDAFMQDIRITDEDNNTIFATVSRKKFPRVEEGTVIKIRSAMLDRNTQRTDTLLLNPYSNIMTIVPFAKILRKLESISMDQLSIDQELLEGDVIHEPVLATEVAEDYEDTEVTKLEDLFRSVDKSTDTFRARFYVIKSSDASDVCQSADKKNGIPAHFKC